MNKERNEFGIRAIIFGILIGLLLQVLGMYLDAVAGLDMNVSPVATMLGILIIPVFGGAASVREINIMQTCASAVVFCFFALTGNYVAMLLMGQEFDFIGTIVPLLLGNVIGICGVTLLRNQYVYDESLPFPQSQMELTALKRVGNLSGKDARLLYIGIAVAILISVPQNFGLIPIQISFDSILSDNMTMGILIMPMMLAMGYFLDMKSGIITVAAVALVGMLQGSFGVNRGWFTDPSADWSGIQTFNLPMVIGMTLVASVLPLLIQWRAFAGAFKLKGKNSSEDSDIPMRNMLLLLAGSSIALIVFCNLYYHVKIIYMILFLVISLFFAVLTVRVQAETGLTAGMALNICIMTLAYLLSKDIMIALLMAFINVQIYVLAQNTMGDLKTGQVVGSSPRKQIWAQLIGIAAGTVTAVFIFYAFYKVYGLDSELFSYPMGHMYQSLVSGLSETGASGIFHLGRFAIGGILGLLLSLLHLPAGIIALSCYLAPATMMSVGVGGIIRGIVEKSKGTEFAERMDNLATGLIIGDGITCVIVLLVTMLG